MKKLRAILGHAWAILAIPVALATLLGMSSWSEGLVAATGLTVSPWFTGGPVVRTVEHGGYRLAIHRPVFDGLIGQTREGFVQLAWSPRQGLPPRIDEEVDLDGDGQTDVRVELDTASGQAAVTPYAERVLGLEGTYELEDSWVVRVNLRNE
jgi:hypothetical protein